MSLGEFGIIQHDMVKRCLPLAEKQFPIGFVVWLTNRFDFHKLSVLLILLAAGKKQGCLAIWLFGCLAGFWRTEKIGTWPHRPPYTCQQAQSQDLERNDHPATSVVGFGCWNFATATSSTFLSHVVISPLGCPPRFSVMLF